VRWTVELLTALEQYYGAGENFEAEDYLYSRGNPRDAILYSSLFMPEFVELKGLVLLKWVVSDEATARISDEDLKTASGRQRIEKEFNWLEVPYLFSDTGIDDEGIKLLATNLCESWRAWLKYKFPQKRFHVGLIDPEITGSTLGIGFYQV
jgi:hypothetical protein